MFETIVWATDGSELADRALPHVTELARVHGSKIVAVHANELLRGRFGGAPLRADEPDVREQIEQQVADLKADGFDAELKVVAGTGELAELIAHAAANVDAGLIVVGTHGHGGFKSACSEALPAASCTGRTARCSRSRPHARSSRPPRRTRPQPSPDPPAGAHARRGARSVFLCNPSPNLCDCMARRLRAPSYNEWCHDDHKGDHPMRKLTAATIAVTAVISAGAGAAAASAAGPTPSRPAADQISIDRHAARAERDRSGVRTTVLRHDRSSDRTQAMEAGR